MAELVPVAAASRRLMGSTALVQVSAASPQRAVDLVEVGLARIESLHRLWTRFDPESALSRLNRAAGRGPVEVCDDLLALVSVMVEVFALTDGRCNPAGAFSMQAAGYVTSYSPAPPAAPAGMPVPFGSMADVLVDRDASTVALPAGVALDPGSIGKGLAASWVASDLHRAGAAGVLVDIGGDLAIAGFPGTSSWVVGVASELDLEDASPVLTLEWAGDDSAVLAIATSSTSRRLLAAGHHLLDPLTGSSLRATGPTALRAASVALTSSDRNVGAHAEALATSVLVDAARTGQVHSPVPHALVVVQHADGRVQVVSPSSVEQVSA